MKKTIALVVLFSAIFSAYFVWQPYRSVANFGEALNANDSKLAAEYVDFAAFRESLKRDAREAAGETKGLEGFVAKVLVNTLADATIDTLVTEENFIEVFKNESSGDNKNESLTLEFESTGRVIVSEAFVLERSGLFTWKFTGFARNTRVK